jgi:hypothetical protein
MSGEINDGGQAFPFRDADGEGGFMTFPGMTLRDYFAAAAMQGLLSSPDGGPDDWQRVADAAYEAADAMLSARERKEESK